MGFRDVPWCSSTISELPRQTDHDTMVFHVIPLNCSTFHDIPVCAVTVPKDWYATLFHNIPQYAIIFSYIQRASKTDHGCAIPRYSLIFHDILYVLRPPKTDHGTTIFDAIPWDCSIFHDLPVCSVSFQDIPWYRDIPRYLVSCWHGRSLSSFCGKGGSGADAPCRRYRNIPNVVLERPRGVLGLSAMHDITTINMPFHDVPKYSMIYSIFSELPRQTMTSWCSMQPTF